MEQIFTYTTLSAPAEGIYTDKGSKFIGYAFPVEKEEDVKAEIKRLRSLHNGARHFCYAWRMGKEVFTERSNDDGEPSGTAGKPILNQLLSAGLTQVCIVVVRYFGGTLLGTTGLIQAYKGAAKEALANAHLVEKEMMLEEELEIFYPVYAELMKLLKKYQVRSTLLFSDEKKMKFFLEIPKKTAGEFKNEITSLKPGEDV